MRKVVIASDSFKGCLTSSEVADSCGYVVKSIFPGCDVIKIPVGDGGEGTVDSLVTSMNGMYIDCNVRGPLGSIVKARYGILEDGVTAVMEMASASGLTLIEESERNPMLTSTFGTGQMIKDAVDRGCRTILMGIGGSATNDGGIGALSALGIRFLDVDGNEVVPSGSGLERIYKIDDTRLPENVKETEFIIACDVDNPFYGENGAAYIFARQKGADDSQIERLDAGLRNFAEVIRRSGRKPVDDVAGAGAAGGLGGGLLAFLNATLKHGIDVVLDTVGFDEKIIGADMVITGEGKMDAQTCMGKTPYGILKRAARKNIPVIAIAGAVEDSEALNEAGFLSVMSIQQRAVELSEAMLPEKAKINIESTVRQILRLVEYGYLKKQN